MDSAGQKSETPSQTSSTISTSQSLSSSAPSTSSSETLHGSTYIPGPEELKTIAALKKL
ncbi:hypothetical protein FRC01_000710 [Tulasnella sp. 417]|nr:hypothetical protein FRC01_000710 [Tulasnella sp. 417]